MSLEDLIAPFSLCLYTPLSRFVVRDVISLNIGTFEF